MLSDNQRYTQVCSMKPCQADKVLKMIESHSVFSVVGMSIKEDRENFDQGISAYVPEGEALVIFDIPRGLDMCDFYREFNRALNQEFEGRGNKEKR